MGALQTYFLTMLKSESNSKCRVDFDYILTSRVLFRCHTGPSKEYSIFTSTDTLFENKLYDNILSRLGLDLSKKKQQWIPVVMDAQLPGHYR
jgi:hypothetical protein